MNVGKVAALPRKRRRERNYITRSFGQTFSRCVRYFVYQFGPECSFIGLGECRCQVEDVIGAGWKSCYRGAGSGG